MGLMAARRVPPHAAVVWEQVRAYQSVTLGMAGVGLLGAGGLLLNWKMGLIAFMDLLGIFDLYCAAAFAGTGMLLAINHQPGAARQPFPARLFRLPMPVETLSTLVLVARLALLAVLWAFLLLLRVLLMAPPESAGLVVFCLIVGLAWFAGLLAANWFVGGRNTLFWWVWVFLVNLSAFMAVFKAEDLLRIFGGGDLIGMAAVALLFMALQCVRAVRFQRSRGLEEEKLPVLDVFRRQTARTQAGAPVFQNALDAEIWFMGRQYRGGRLWMFPVMFLAAAAAKYFLGSFGLVGDPDALLFLLLAPIALVAMHALYWMISDAYRGRVGALAFVAARPLSTADFARARLVVASRQVLWDLALVAGVPLLVMWVIPPWPVLFHPEAWPMVFNGFYQTLGWQELRLFGAVVLLLWVIRAIPPSTAWKAALIFGAPLVTIWMAEIYDLDFNEKNSIEVVSAVSVFIGGLLSLLLLLSLLKMRRLRVAHWMGLAAAVAAWMLLFHLYGMDVHEIIKGLVLWSYFTSRGLVRGDFIGWGYELAFMTLGCGLAALAVMPFAAMPLQWHRWRHRKG